VGRERFFVRRFLRDESGASSIEHALLACIFALVVVYAVASGVSPAAVYEKVAAMTGLMATEATPSTAEDSLVAPELRRD
jgi:Flp pilus assembly pilin Flp